MTKTHEPYNVLGKRMLRSNPAGRPRNLILTFQRHDSPVELFSDLLARSRLNTDHDLAEGAALQMTER
jgi:hypothetical protein